jgi:phosphosulfolactate synthase (CoM biosynthesis protein A)
MKKISLLITTAALLAIGLQAQETNPTPSIIVGQNVVTNLTVQPIILTAAQMDGLIGAVKSAGIEANVPISSTNLQSVIVVRQQIGTNTFFRVSMRVK